MGYRLSTSDADLAQGFRRVAARQLDKAIVALDPATADPHEAVHDARKRCKKVRALVRLFRDAFPAYKAENRSLRDAARLLSDLRDRTAVIETYDRLLGRYGDVLNRSAFAPLRASFTRERNAAGTADDMGDRMTDMAEALRSVRGRVDDWQLDRAGFDAVEGGLVRTYGRARDAMARAEATRAAEDLHQWRKRVKYHWYHMRLLSGAQSEPITAREQSADRLSDLLGDHHDLEAFAPRLDATGLREEARLVFRGLLTQEAARLEEEAFTLGAALFAPKPKRLVKDLRPAVTTWYAGA